MRPTEKLQKNVRWFGMVAGIALWMGLISTPVDATPVSGKQELGKEETARVAANYGKLPLSFERNQGQTNSKVEYLSRGPGYTLFLSRAEAVLSLKPLKKSEEKPEATKVKGSGHLHGKDQFIEGESGQGAAIALKWLGAKPKSGLKGIAPLPGRMNYFIGSDPAKWQTNVPTYSEVALAGLYPGIDIRYYGSNEGRLEYDLIVAPKANPNQIRLEMSGAEQVKIDERGAVIASIGELDLQLAKPVIYQECENGREIVSGGYRLISENKKGVVKATVIAFDLGAYDRKRPLVIDPVIEYSTYLGGSGNDEGRGIAVDESGAAYVTGETNSLDFPTTLGKGYSDNDIFVAKISADGSALVYGTRMGGSSFDYSYGIAVDGVGNAYVTGTTYSSDFPTTLGALATDQNGLFGGFVAKISADGSALVYGTYLGKNSYAEGNGIAVDRAGMAYVTGDTSSSDFPTTTGALDTSYNGGGNVVVGGDAFVAKISADGSALVYGTYLGGSGRDGGYGIVVDRTGAAYVTGETRSFDFPVTPRAFDTSYSGGSNVVLGGDAFVVKLSPDGSTLVYSTLLGGSDYDGGDGIAVDEAGRAYVTGNTFSSDFPATSGTLDTIYDNCCSDAFVAKISTDGSSLVYGTYVGGHNDDYGRSIVVDGAGSAYVTGNHYSDPIQSVHGYSPCCSNAFVAKISADGSVLAYETYMGWIENDYGSGIAVDGAGNAYVTGTTHSFNFPTTTGAFDTSYNRYSDAFVAKISFETTTTTTTTTSTTTTTTTTTTSTTTTTTLPPLDTDGDGIADVDDECPLLPTTNTIIGTAGNDTLVGTSANDLIRGLDGNDIIRGKGGDDCLVGGAGNDTLKSDAGNDQLAGGDGNDSLSGGSGDDRMIGGQGRDRVAGGAGADTLVISAGDVSAGVTEKQSGGSGTDTVELGAGIGVADITSGAVPGTISVTDPTTGGIYKVKTSEVITDLP